jgi:hypothetical protein
MNKKSKKKLIEKNYNTPAIYLREVFTMTLILVSAVNI